MANRVKEDERNERIIRGLLKLTENRRCINCNSLGPQYVCTNFWAFICTTCSGIHREFTHRVKSVSMAKFTSQEVKALQEGGNKCAKEIYFKEWDSQRQSIPDSSNVERLREFIKHVYVDRRYSGGKNYEKPSRGKMGDKEDSRGGSGSPPYEDTYEWRRSEISSPGGRSDDRNSRYSYDERRSPGYDQDSRQYGDNRKSPAHPEILNDWRREDRFGNGRKFEDRGISNGDSKLDGKSPERPKDLDTSSPPMVRPVRDILGENVIPLRISGPPKANNGRTADGSAHTQRTDSSSSLGSTNGTPVEVKWQSSGSLIDFDADPEPSFGTAVSEAQQTTMPHSSSQPASTTNDNNWASFDFSPQPKVSESPNVNVLESALSNLSVPSSVPNHIAGIPAGTGSLPAGPMGNTAFLSVGGNSTAAPGGYAPMFPYTVTAPAAASVSSLSTIPPGGVAAHGLTSMLPVSGGNSAVTVTDAGQWPNMQHQQPYLFPATGSQSTYQQYTPLHCASGIQPWNPLAPNAQVPPSSSAVQAPQSVSQPAMEATSGVLSQPSSAESGRKELPQDLFTVSYFPVPVPTQGWQSVPPHGMGFSIQHNTGVAQTMPTYPQLSKSANPFDLGDEPPPVQAPTFPSMASLQGALPNVPPSSGIMRTSSLGAPSATWMSPESSPYTSAMPPYAPSYASAMPPRPYIAQPVPSNIPPSRHQLVAGGYNPDQQLAGRYSAPATPNPYSSVGGNPFG